MEKRSLIVLIVMLMNTNVLSIMQFNNQLNASMQHLAMGTIQAALEL